MFDDIKTWLNHAGILFNGPAHCVRVQEFKFNRSALGCAVASTAGVTTTVGVTHPHPVGPHPGDMILSGPKGILPYKATPPHHIVRGYPTGVLHNVAFKILKTKTEIKFRTEDEVLIQRSPAYRRKE